MSARPDSAALRYDRQLRLWAPSGQAALESASGLSSQIAKNLVLPGVGQVTIADSRAATESDAGVNFFLEESSVGKYAAPEIARLLSEMNPAVTCTGMVAEPKDLVNDVPFVARHSLAIAVRQPPDVVDALATTCAESHPPIPLLVADSSGFTGLLSLCTPELCLVEIHPESFVDLRLTRPFPELDEYVDSFDLDALDSHERSHVPYVVIIRKALAACDKVDRAAVRAAIDAMREGVDQENFDEAVSALAQHVWRPLGSSAVPANVQQVLDLVGQRRVDTAFVQKYGVRNARFWLFAAALGRFIDSAKVLPLPGAVPDMKAESKQYVKLQSIYKAKANQDISKFEKLLDDVLADVSLGRDDVGIDADSVRTFVRHAAMISVVPARRWSDRLHAPRLDAIKTAFEDPVNPPTVQHYLAYVAARHFQSTLGRFPGESDAVEQDEADLISLCSSYASTVGVTLDEQSAQLVRKACQEMPHFSAV
ncbi:hypothetical protein MCUN1_003704 [Malassezia cuniculi]|uniref:NEDD8-activating enzyme E1 regulatory subunit n=1 Tax=Malassezia cuniculi TaxID=948313 RepID=A0AAF0EYI1_9BASI|nr:hypothetical protein MCUN1_003704 [Malassezia cuniculi]